MYIDGHERDDVVSNRSRYVHELATYLPYMCQYGGDRMDIVTPPQKTDKAEVILVVHDETVLHQNDGEDWRLPGGAWGPLASCLAKGVSEETQA